MKMLLRILFTAFIITTLMVSSVFAAPFNPAQYTSVEIQSDLLPPHAKQNRVRETARARGNFFSAADLIISNEGNGDIGAFAKAYMDIPVDEVYITIYLDRWNEVTERWKQVTFYDAEFYAADYPDGLVNPSVDIVFKNQTKGYYYRMRGVFAAVYNDKFEGFSPTTAGILIE